MTGAELTATGAAGTAVGADSRVRRRPSWSPSLLPTLRAFAIPMPVKFRGTTVRQGALLQGPAGWGEFSPFPEYGPRECARWLACALESAACGWPAPVRDSVPVNVTVPHAAGPEQAHAIVTRSGCRTAKVKVAEPGQPESDDIARVEAVRDAIGPGGKVRIDANGGWDVDVAARMLIALAPFDLEYAEQPCASLADMAALRRRVDVPLAADESIRRAEDPLKVRAAGAADIVVLKAQPLGGVRAGLEIAAACGLPVVVSSAVDTSVGLAAGVALAAALPELPYACGLATMSLLAGDVTAEPLTEAGGELPVRPAVVDQAELARWEVDARDWRARLLAAAQFLLYPVPASPVPGPTADPACTVLADCCPARAAVNSSTAFATVLVDELIRCGLREAVVAPGSRSAPLAMALHAASSRCPAWIPAAPARAHRRAVGVLPRARPG